MTLPQRRRYETHEHVRLGGKATLGASFLRGTRLSLPAIADRFSTGLIRTAVSSSSEGPGGGHGIERADRYLRLTWVASALTDGDRRVAADAAAGGTIPSTLEESALEARFVSVPPAVFQRFYYTFANPLLWFLQHYRCGPVPATVH